MSRSARVALLDVNVLIALFDPDHIHHDIAHDWFTEQRRFGWATCPLTENGFLRIAGHIARARDPLAVATLEQALRTFTESGQHQFWRDDLTILREDTFDLASLRGHQQLTDVYLLGLAVKHKAALATFDRSIPLDAVSGARREHVVLLAPAE